MSNYFPRTLKAAQTNEQSQWAIGDALIKEADDKTTGSRGLTAVAKELADNGIDLTTNYLAGLRRNSEAFPADRRHSLPWAVHQAAGNPETLDVIARAAKKSHTKVTLWYVLTALKQQRDDARSQREKAQADAQKLVDKAQADERNARERERTASPMEKASARRLREEAEARRRTAVETAKTIRVVPKKKDRVAPAEDDVPLMVIKSKLMSAASDSEALAVRSEKEVATYAADLSPAALAGLIEGAMSAANAWTRVAAILRKVSPKKDSHLSVVNQ